MNDTNTMESLSYAGLRLQIVTIAEAHALLWSCPLCRPQGGMAL